jgi:predicted PurR-regulated permease PerM
MNDIRVSETRPPPRPRSRAVRRGRPVDAEPALRDTALRALVSSVVVVAVVVGALALWKLRLLVFLLFLGFTLAAAMRPGVEALGRRGVPRAAGVIVHFAGIAVVIGLLLWLAVPPAIDQVSQAIGNVPTSSAELGRAAKNSTGLKHEFLVGLQKQLEDLPSGAALVHPAITITTKALEVLVGILFTLATAGYWIFERERAQRLVLSIVPRPRRRIVCDTWNLIDLKLGAFVRGQLLMITFVSSVLSASFALIGLPYWLLLGVCAGVLEIVPVIGPLAAGTLAVLVGLTIDWQHAVYAAIAVYGLRLIQDYLINPNVFGRVVGLSPLIVLTTVSAVGLLFGGIYVPLSVPLAAMIATLVDVIVMDRDPADQDVPKVIFPAKDSEA